MIDGKVGVADGGPGVKCCKCRGAMDYKALQHNGKIYCILCWEKHLKKVK